MHLVVLYKSVITGLLWILLLSGALPSSYLSLRKEIKVLDSGFPWNLSLGTEACNKLVRDGGQVLQNCVKVSDLVKLPPPDLHRAAFVGLGCSHCWFFLPCLGCGSRRELRFPWLCPLALSTFFWPFTGLSYPFFYMENLAFLVGVSRKAEKSDFLSPPKLMSVVSFLKWLKI